MSSVDQALLDGWTMAARIDVAALLTRPWAAALEKPRGLLSIPGACGKNPLHLVDAVAFSSDGTRQLLVAKRAARPLLTTALGTSGEGVPDDAGATGCLLALGAKPRQLSGHPAYELGGYALIVNGEYLALGTDEAVLALMAGATRSDTKRDALIALPPSGLFAFRSERGLLVDGRVYATLGSDQTAFALWLDVEMANHAAAANLRKQLVDTPPIEFEVNGAHLMVRVATKGDGAEQTVFVSDLLDRLTEGVHAFFTTSKSAEAETAVGTIARRIVEHAKRKTPVVLPESSTFAPPAVPKGHKVESSPKDWDDPSWKSIGYEMPGLVNFRYHWETAADRRSLWVIGEGDLDGDGVLSTYKIKVTVKGNTIVVDPELTILNDGE